MFSLSRVARRGHENRVNGEYTKNTRGGLASLQLRTDVSLLASLYPERADRCPFSTVLSFFPPSRFSLSLFLLPVQSVPLYHTFPLPSHAVFLSLSFSSVPPSSPLPPSPGLTFQLRVSALPISHSFHFSSPLTVHRFNHECLLLSHGIRIVLLVSHISPPLFFHLSFPVYLVLLSLSCFHRSFALPLLRHPTQPAFLSLDLRPSLGEAPSSAARLSSSRRIWTCPFSVSLLFFLSFSLSLSMFRGGSLHSLSFSPFSAVFAPSHDSSRLLSAATAITWLQH